MNIRMACAATALVGSLIPLSSSFAASTFGYTGVPSGTAVCSPTGSAGNLTNISATEFSVMGSNTSGGVTTYYLNRLSAVVGVAGSGTFQTVSAAATWVFNSNHTLSISEAGSTASGTWAGTITPAFGGYAVSVTVTLPGCAANIPLSGTMFFSGT
jgi:hypothetical protein